MVPTSPATKRWPMSRPRPLAVRHAGPGHAPIGDAGDHLAGEGAGTGAEAGLHHSRVVDRQKL